MEQNLIVPFPGTRLYSWQWRGRASQERLGWALRWGLGCSEWQWARWAWGFGSPASTPVLLPMPLWPLLLKVAPRESECSLALHWAFECPLFFCRLHAHPCPPPSRHSRAQDMGESGYKHRVGLRRSQFAGHMGVHDWLAWCTWEIVGGRQGGTQSELGRWVEPGTCEARWACGPGWAWAQVLTMSGNVTDTELQMSCR
ncbi:hypothetical protein B0H10DRAFT_1951035 [Mycena sp. CBHHK59/15]|nr:hypothetical protein B0H10DRAFT_1951035 [Mycena sp. CBHHK59/15]